MATESPIMISSHKEQAFSSSSRNVYVEDMRLMRKGQSFPSNGKDSIPDRSGSAPPSIEGSYLAVNNLASQQIPSVSSGKLRNAAQIFDSENQSNAGSYPVNSSRSHRTPTPPIPKENRLPSIFYGGSWKFGSIDGNTKKSSYVQTSLATHNEECEDDQSTDQPSINLNDRLWSNDLIHEDLPRTPSPVYNQAHSVSSITDNQADGESNSFHESPVNSSTNLDVLRQPFSSEASLIPVASTSSLNYSVPSQPVVLLRKGNNSGESMSSIESGMKNINISTLLVSKEQGTPDQWHQNYFQPPYPLQNNPQQVHNMKSHVAGFPYMPMDNFFQGVPKPCTEAQPLLQSSGFTPPLYASYMTSPAPYYPNFQSSGLYQQQYSLAGYPSSSGMVPSHYIGGFPLPLPYDGPTNPNFSGRGAAPVTNIPIGSDVQSLSKVGYAPQTTFVDPFYMQYYQQPFGSAYGHPGQYDPLGSGNQNLFPEPKKGSEFVPGSDDQKTQIQRPSFGYVNHVRGGIIAPHYLGSPQNMSLVMPHGPSPLAVPIYSGVKDDSRHVGVSNRYATVFSGWQGRRVAENFNDPRIHNFLEELKSGKGRRFELSDITGYIVEFSTDQHGSRFIQQKLEICSPEEKATVFQEVLPYAPKLMTDVFGNYVVQKFFEYGTPDQRKELANQLSGQILPLSLQMYGCRVIQKALDVIDIDQKEQLIIELEGHVLRCVRDQNGNHVIQKCIESVPAEKIGFIISAFRGQVATLSMHPYGCRVIQRVLEHCTDEYHFQFIVDEILESVYVLSQDQYGNYVTQHVMERGKPHERLQIVNRLLGHIVQLSQHKFASNVIEKCLEYGCVSERSLIIDEVLSESERNDNLLVMMKDQFANYVVQKILDTCTDVQRLSLLGRIRPHLHALKKYTYGKHIVGRFEQQFGEEESA